MTYPLRWGVGLTDRLKPIHNDRPTIAGARDAAATMIALDSQEWRDERRAIREHS